MAPPVWYWIQDIVAWNQPMEESEEKKLANIAKSRAAFPVW